MVENSTYNTFAQFKLIKAHRRKGTNPPDTSNVGSNRDSERRRRTQREQKIGLGRVREHRTA